MIKKTLKINGVERILILDKDETLAQVLRNHLLLTGCKIGCGEGHCGACNVIMNGKVTRSCIYKMSRVPDNAEITTIEGVGTISDMHPIQVAWMAYGCAQCGFCSPGFIISAKVLLDNNPSPTREEVREWFNKQRNLCRCTGYKPLIDATMAAAAVMRGEMTKEDLVFKQTGDSIVGTNYIRPSAAQKVTGTWDFGADDALKMPEGTLRLALTQAKVSHANILSIDTTEAEGMPGVFRVITAKDIKAAGGTNKINGLVMLPKHNKTDGFERPVLCDEKIFQFGDAIAIVAADTEEHARAAADAVKVEIEELPAYMNAMDAIAPDAAEIHPGVPNAFFETNCIKGPDFDWDSIFEDAVWFHFTGITPALGGNLVEICLQACQAAKAKGIKISCDLNYRGKLWSRAQARAAMTELCRYVDVCIANEEDAKDIFSIEAADSDIYGGKLNKSGYESVARQLAGQFGFEKVAITLRTSLSASDNNWAGMLYDGTECHVSKEYHLHIVDRVGGGDSFAGGLIYALLSGKSAQDTIEFAVAASALKHSVEGDFNRVTCNEVEKLASGDGSGRVQR